MKSARKKKKPAKPKIIGWREWVSLPDLDVSGIKAKIDTGARTSTIHAWHIVPFERDGKEWVRFELHPQQRNNKIRVQCQAPVKAKRSIKNSGGTVQYRYIVVTTLMLGELRWPIELSLTNRDEMGFRMLLGRAALRRRLIVNPWKSFLLSGPSKGSAKADALRAPG